MNNPSIPLSSSSSSSSWSCTRCTFLNRNPQSTTCQICLYPKPPPKPFSPSSSSAPQSPPRWACKACTFLNPYNTKTCKICETRCSLFNQELGLDDPVVESVGSVFWPLRRCGKGGSDPIDQDVVDEEMVECVGLSVAKRKAVEVDGAEGMDEGFGLRGVKSSKRVSVLGELFGYVQIWYFDVRFLAYGSLLVL